MKNLTILKQYQNFQTAHLYEHMFCAAVHNLFLQNALYAQLDYFIRGTAYRNSGVIMISIDAYTPEAKMLLGEVIDIQLDMSEELLLVAMKQLVAEQKIALRAAKTSRVIAALETIQQLSWTTLDSLTRIDSTSRMTKWPIYQLDNHVETRPIYIDIHINKAFTSDNQQLLPLFIRFSQYIGSSTAESLSRLYGYYYEDDYYSKDRLAVRFILSTLNSQQVDLEAMMQKVCEHLLKLQDQKPVQRFVCDLQNISYENNALGAPNVESIIEELGIVIGAEGWRTIGTLENIQMLCDVMSIDLSYGRNKLSRRLPREV